MAGLHDNARLQILGGNWLGLKFASCLDGESQHDPDEERRAARPKSNPPHDLRDRPGHRTAPFS